MKKLTLAILQVSTISALLLATSVQATENTSARLSAQQEAEAAAIQARMIAERDEAAQAQAERERVQAETQRRAQSSTQAKENVQQRLADKENIYTQLESLGASNLPKLQSSPQFVPASAELRLEQQKAAAIVKGINYQLLSKGKISTDEIIQTSAELNKDEQAKALTEAVIFAHGGKDNINKMIELPLESFRENAPVKITNCLEKKLLYPNFLRFVYQQSKEYIAQHSDEDMYQTLILINDSGFSKESNQLTTDLLAGLEDTDLVLKLHMLQDPKLKVGFTAITIDDDTNQLPYLMMYSIDGIFNDFVKRNIKQCRNITQ
ncbi:hypothetical protein [Psychrobacter sp. I-STPA10]|uniref:hypothetical protein n=1 Tax=Psychrobacter sp. I-STPA10 TaxID=2585769 RepID=UPI001E65B6A1|nr:hypothetical protein [Psychrobacter sp. I-STPA10]